MTKMFHYHHHLNPRAVPNFFMPNNSYPFILHTSYTLRCRHISSLLMVTVIRACLHEGGVPQVGEVTCGGLLHLSCKCDHTKGLFTWSGGPRSIVGLVSFVFTLWGHKTKETYPTRPGSPTPCKQALKWEIIWTGQLPHLSGSPHLSGVPHLHVNRPLEWFYLTREIGSRILRTIMH